MLLRKDLRGQTFGEWRVLELEGKRGPHAYYTCQCSCGTVQGVAGYNLRSGKSTQCTDCRSEVAAKKRTTHGKSKTVEYRTWQAMKTRCYNPKSRWYAYWGGRGVRVAPEWINDFPAFLAHVGPRAHPGLSIDRIDSNGHYEPGNVRWATAHQQAKNRRDWRSSGVVLH